MQASLFRSDIVSMEYSCIRRADGVISGAIFSDDRKYRYKLWRTWGGDPQTARVCVFVGINPSVADEHEDDQTIRKDIGFARRWGFDGIVKLNPFALASTDQRGLLAAADPVGPDNDRHMRETFECAARVVWAWGAGKTLRVTALLQRRLRSAEWYTAIGGITCETGTLGHTKDGFPRHPLMLPYETAFEREDRSLRS